MQHRLCIPWLITLSLWFVSLASQAAYVEVVKNANMYASASSASNKIRYINVSDPQAATAFYLLSEETTNGYYHVQLPRTNQTGWIYKTRIRLHTGELTDEVASQSVYSNLPLGPNEMRAHFINVGQGDATLLEFSCGVMLIDSGGEKNADYDSNAQLSAYLSQFFDHRPEMGNNISVFVLTHPHIDHTRGSTWLRKHSGITVLNYVDNGQQKGSGGAQQRGWQTHTQALPEMGYQVVKLNEINQEGLTNSVIDPINCGEGTNPDIRVLWGALSDNPGWPREHGKDPFVNANNHSITVRVDFGETSFLFTGDMEHAALAAMIEKYQGTSLLDVDVYQVGHHASKNATTAPLMNAMSPDIAVISAGSAARQRMWTAWKYGHPHQTAMNLLTDPDKGVNLRREPITVNIGQGGERFEEAVLHSAVYMTGWDGHVVLQADSKGRITPILER